MFQECRVLLSTYHRKLRPGCVCKYPKDCQIAIDANNYLVRTRGRLRATNLVFQHLSYRWQSWRNKTSSEATRRWSWHSGSVQRVAVNRTALHIKMWTYRNNTMATRQFSRPRWKRLSEIDSFALSFTVGEVQQRCSSWSNGGANI